MKIIVYGGMGQVSGWLLAGIEGFRKHGLNPALVPTGSPINCDLAVFWSHRKRNIIELQKKNKKDYLVFERGYFGDRFKLTSCGFNGLNGDAVFYHKDKPGDRWKRHGVTVNPWQGDEVGDRIVIAGQVQGDMSIHSYNLRKYYTHLWEDLKRLCGGRGLPYKIVFKPHPLSKVDVAPKGIPIVDNLKGARWVIAINSNLLVEAAIGGIPVIALDKKSMVWEYASNDPASIVSPFVPWDRKPWLHDLAYTQWSLKEIKDGTMWEHLKQRYR